MLEAYNWQARKPAREVRTMYKHITVGGAGAHNDGYCESVVSLQLRGDKRWRSLGLTDRKSVV